MLIETASGKKYEIRYDSTTYFVGEERRGKHTGTFLVTEIAEDGSRHTLPSVRRIELTPEGIIVPDPIQGTILKTDAIVSIY